MTMVYMLCAVAASLPGNFLLLRRMSLLGDAISHAILHQYMTPGVWIVSQTNTNGSVAASLATPSLMSTPQTSPDASDSTRMLNHHALVRISQQLHRNLNLDLSYKSHSQPTITLTQILSPNLKVTSNLDAQGLGWISCQCQVSVPNIFQSHRPIDTVKSIRMSTGPSF